MKKSLIDMLVQDGLSTADVRVLRRAEAIRALDSVDTEARLVEVVRQIPQVDREAVKIKRCSGFFFHTDGQTPLEAVWRWVNPGVALT